MQINSPYDTQTRYSVKRTTSWAGYKVHVTETCDEDTPHLLTDVQTTVATTRTTVRAQIAADKAAITAACPTPASTTHTACVNARHTEGLAIKALHSQLLIAVHTYYKTVEADRRAFWAEIKAVRPLHHAAADKPIKVENS